MYNGLHVHYTSNLSLRLILKFGISSINAIIVTSLITIVGNYINNKIVINKGGSSSYENK